MGVLHYEPIKIKMYGGQVASEPAFVTSCESANLCSNPGLTAYDPLKSSNDESIQYIQIPESQAHLPCKGSYSSKDISIDTVVGSVFQYAAAYNPSSDAWPFALSPEFQDVNQHIFANNTCNAPRRQRRYQKRRCDLLIATQLSQLQGEDPRKLLIVRKINRLGFNSASILEEHYGRFGTVSKVLLSNKHEKDAGAPFPTRLRPSGIGFVLFESVEGAAEALAQGSSQVVAGVDIVVSRFEKRRSPGDSSSPGDGTDDVDGGADSSGSNMPEAKRVTDQSLTAEIVNDTRAASM